MTAKRLANVFFPKVTFAPSKRKVLFPQSGNFVPSVGKGVPSKTDVCAPKR